MNKNHSCQKTPSNSDAVPPKTIPWTQCLAIILAVLFPGTGSPVQGQPTVDFTTLYTFSPSFAGGSLIQGSDGSFYGTTEGGGGYGTVFKMNSAGNLTSLVSFNGTNGYEPNSVIQGADGNFYGTTYGGGDNGYGTIFKMTPAGDLTILYSFSNPNPPYYTNSDGVNPEAGVVQASDGNFYGTAVVGGANTTGTIFKITQSGSFTNLYTFSADSGNGENLDGENPGQLVCGTDGNIYGTTAAGGAYGDGTIFKMTMSGTLTNLFSFNGTNGVQPHNLIQGLDGIFYGITWYTDSGDGTIFKITSDGSWANLVSFDSFSGPGGAYPEGGLVQGKDGNFYGTTKYGGTSGSFGTVFEMSPSGNLIYLYLFTGGADSSGPTAALTQAADGSFYGTTSFYKTGGSGTIFRFTTSQTLDITNQPTGVTAFSGGTTTFTVGVFGAASYQWALNGTSIFGATNASLTLTNLTLINAGIYTVMVSNAIVSVTSMGATLVVTCSPAQATAIVDNGFVVGVNLITGGYGYTNSPAVIFIGQGGAGAVGYAEISNGSVTNIVITNAGFNYPADTLVQIAPPIYPTLTLAEVLTNMQSATAKPIITNGFIVGANITSEGSGYVVAPTVSFNDANGHGAAGFAETSSGSVTNIVITEAGGNYSPNTILTLSPSPTLKVVTLSASNLMVGQYYQTQTGSDLKMWSNAALAFAATNTIWTATNSWDIANTNQLFFRLTTP